MACLAPVSFTPAPTACVFARPQKIYVYCVLALVSQMQFLRMRRRLRPRPSAPSGTKYVMAA